MGFVGTGHRWPNQEVVENVGISASTVIADIHGWRQSQVIRLLPIIDKENQRNGNKSNYVNTQAGLLIP